MDIVIRARPEIGGDRRQVLDTFLHSGEAHYFRGKKPGRASTASRVYFLQDGAFHGYARFIDYAWRNALPSSGAQSGGAIIVGPPYVPIDPPLPIPVSFRMGSWRWRYAETDPNVMRLLRERGL